MCAKIARNWVRRYAEEVQGIQVNEHGKRLAINYAQKCKKTVGNEVPLNYPKTYTIQVTRKYAGNHGTEVEPKQQGSKQESICEEY